MKNETARREIESLDYYLQNHTDDYSEESHTAMMMAIKALEQQPCEDCISREAVLDVINFEDEWLFDAKSHNADTKVAFSGLNSRVKALPSVTSQASEEDIHREREQAYMLGYEDASKRFRTEPCEDAISRSDLLQKIQEAPTHLNETWDELYDSVIDDINSMPSVTPQAFINKPCVSEGVCREDKIQVIEKIRAEIVQMNEDVSKMLMPFDSLEKVKYTTGFIDGLGSTLDVIDKYREGGAE